MLPYRDRLVGALVAEVLRELPAILIVGPRAVGKTTTARRFARTVIRLDRDPEAAAFRADPDVALRGLPEPVLLDEWQAVPLVLGALKRAVDDDPRPGRFLLTGSIRADLEADTWPGTGRLTRVGLSGMVAREVLGSVDGDLLGRILDSFVMAQVRGEISVSASGLRRITCGSSRAGTRWTLSSKPQTVGSSASK